MATKDKSQWTIKRILLLMVLALGTFALVGVTIIPGFMVKQQAADQQAAQDKLAKQCGNWKDLDPKEMTPPKFEKHTGPVKKLIKQDIKVGTGDEVKSGDCIRARYIGWVLKDGKVFDGNYDKNVPNPHVGQAEFSLSMVIKGWSEGVPGMKVGGIRRLIIPAELAYGKEGSPPSIPANADLEFVVEVTDINHDAPPIDISSMIQQAQ